MGSSVLHRNKRVYQKPPAPAPVPCVFWRAGRCNRRPCRFLHAEQPPSASATKAKRCLVWRRDATSSSGANLSAAKRPRPPVVSHKADAAPVEPFGNEDSITKTADEIFVDVVPENQQMEQAMTDDKNSKIAADTVRNDSNCTLLATLLGHQQAISGIAFAAAANRLLVGSKDGTISVWDSFTGQRVRVNNMGGEVGALLAEQHWSFMGVFDSFRAYNSQTKTQYIIEDVGGEVRAIAASHGLVFAGIQDGSILAWQFDSEELISVQPMASLDGHTLPVVSLLVHGGDKLYSGSMDHTIRVWDLTSLRCVQTIHGHASSVMSLLSWGSYILSCSLDNSIKIWATFQENQQLQLVYTHKESNGIVSLCGISDANGKSILICARSDRSVCLCDLPSFTEMGQIHFSEDLRVVKSDPSGLFFTGVAAGELRVWSFSS